MYWPFYYKMFLEIYVLKSILSDIIIATTNLLCLPYAWSITVKYY